MAVRNVGLRPPLAAPLHTRTIASASASSRRSELLAGNVGSANMAGHESEPMRTWLGLGLGLG